MLLLPDLGDLLRLHPQYNAGTVVEALRWLGAPGRVAWLSGADPDHPLRDALPAAGYTLLELAPDWSWADDEHAELGRFLAQYPQGRERLRAAAQAEAAFAQQLSAPLTPAQVTGPELLAAAQAYHAAKAQALDEGPGTRWQARRIAELASALAEAALPGDTVALAALDDLPGLLAACPGTRLADLSGLVPGESSRLRALADRAWQLHEEDDLATLYAALLREEGDAVTPTAELRAAAAHLALATGHLSAARSALEDAAHRLSGREGRSLAGLVLARLGQVRDAQGERELAERTYRAVLALAYAPAVATEAARSGLERPFMIETGGGDLS